MRLQEENGGWKAEKGRRGSRPAHDNTHVLSGLTACRINGAPRKRVFRIAHPPPTPTPALLWEEAAARCQLLTTETPHPRVSCMTPEGATSQGCSPPLSGKGQTPAQGKPPAAWQGAPLQMAESGGEPAAKLRGTPPTLPGRQPTPGLLGNVVPASCPEKRRCVDPLAPKTPRPG